VIWTSGRLQKQQLPCASCTTTIYWDDPVYFRLHTPQPLCQTCYRKQRQKGDELLNRPSQSWAGSQRAIASGENAHIDKRKWASHGG